MGIEFSHCDAHWAYSGFMRFRTRLAAELDIPLSSMAGFREGGTSWGDLPVCAHSDPVVDLLNHSDCDGELTPEQCRRIAPRLRELVDPWPADDYDRQQAMRLADGMDEAARADEPLVFW